MTTERLYYRDAYLASFSAHVVEHADGGRRIYLDQTALYPTSGGQPADRGTLNGIPVLDVVDQEDRIAHLLDRPLEASEVHGQIDWARRFDHMQQHTAQHLLSALCSDLSGYETLSVHFGAEYSTIDLDTPALTSTELLRLGEHANACVAENREILVTFEDAQTATGLRKASDRTGALRIVTIERLDRSACGGTHVRRTGELGAILLRGSERVKQHTRLTFLAGQRAIRAANADFHALTSLARSLGCAPGELATLVPAQAEQLRLLSHQLKKADEELAQYHAADHYTRIVPDATGVRWLVDRRTGAAEGARSLALAFSELNKAVFVALCTEGPSLLIATSADSGVDAGAWLKAAVGSVGGRGGGSPRLAQGRLPNAEALDHIASTLPSL